MAQYLLGYLLLINIVTYFVYGLDKRKARKKQWRIPEAQLLFLAVLGGSVGALLGMRIFHHKTKKRKFFLGVPVIFIIQVILLGVLYFL